jgi:hypothetical protein
MAERTLNIRSVEKALTAAVKHNCKVILFFERFEVLTVVLLKILIIWDVMPYLPITIVYNPRTLVNHFMLTNFLSFV